MIYLVIEIQKDFSGEIAYVVTKHTTLSDAESKYHSVLSYAAISNLASHSATLLTDNGFALKREFYEHTPPAPEPEEPEEPIEPDPGEDDGEGEGEGEGE